MKNKSLLLGVWLLSFSSLANAQWQGPQAGKNYDHMVSLVNGKMLAADRPETCAIEMTFSQDRMTLFLKKVAPPAPYAGPYCVGWVNECDGQIHEYSCSSDYWVNYKEQYVRCDEFGYGNWIASTLSIWNDGLVKKDGKIFEKIWDAGQGSTCPLERP